MGTLIFLYKILHFLESIPFEQTSSYLRMISIPKFGFSLKINISIHNWSSKKISSIRYTQYVHISFWTLKKWLYLRPQQSTRILRPFFRLSYNHFLRVQNKICTYCVYLTEHIFSSSNYVLKYWFSKESPILGILIILR